MRYNLKESGTRIRELRKQNNMTQGILAERLNINITNIGRIERGEQGMSMESLIELSLFFGVSIDYIVLGNETQADTIRGAIRSAIETLKEIEKKI